jgi:hypothetical protein
MKADVETNRAVDSLDNLEHGGFPSYGKDGEAAKLASARRDELSVGQRLKDLGEETLGRICGEGEIGQQGTGLTGELGEVNHDTDAVVCGSRELHGGVAFFRGRTVCWMRLHAFTDRCARSGLFRSKFPIESRVAKRVTTECIGDHRRLFVVRRGCRHAP